MFVFGQPEARRCASLHPRLTPGTYLPNQCGTDTNYAEFCAAGPCPERDTNNGRPDVFANRSRGAAAAERLANEQPFAIGLTALDDVFRVHATTRQAARPRRRDLDMAMDCAVSSPPSIQLQDRHFILRYGHSHTMEWAIYPFTGNCTDFYCFVNAQRHDQGAHEIVMESGGFVGPPDSTHQDTTTFNTSCMTINGTMSKHDGCYSSCIDPDAPRGNTKEQRANHSGQCWEHWSATRFLRFLQAQSGPGGFALGQFQNLGGSGTRILCFEPQIRNRRRTILSFRCRKRLSRFCARGGERLHRARALLTAAVLRGVLCQPNGAACGHDSIHSKHGRGDCRRECTAATGRASTPRANVQPGLQSFGA